MTKDELVTEITNRTGVDKKEALQILETFMTSVKNSLIAGENVYLRGFGTFQVKHRAEKKARNISKNSRIIVPAHNSPFFKPANDFKEVVKQKRRI